MKDYKKILKGVINIINTTEKGDIGFVNICTYISENCPELKESEDERVRRELLAVINDLVLPDDQQSRFVAWLEKQGEPNPYSGVSFEYNGHTWGMCARDGGVDIGYDKQLIANINPIREKDGFDNFSKAVDNKPIGYNTGDFIMCTAPNCN